MTNVEVFLTWKLETIQITQRTQGSLVRGRYLKKQKKPYKINRTKKKTQKTPEHTEENSKKKKMLLHRLGRKNEKKKKMAKAAYVKQIE